MVKLYTMDDLNEMSNTDEQKYKNTYTYGSNLSKCDGGIYHLHGNSLVDKNSQSTKITPSIILEKGGNKSHLLLLIRKILIQCIRAMIQKETISLIQ